MAIGDTIERIESELGDLLEALGDSHRAVDAEAHASHERLMAQLAALPPE